ncbi:MAG: carbohydrate ABC transporter permease [Eubacteriaceae bacterium]|nr:carbohydrate ABC transporter permease [Eubacteriaceae bacterium]
MKEKKILGFPYKFIPKAIMLAVVALLVWWVVWFMLIGSLMSLEELEATIGPALAGIEGDATWPILPAWPTLQPVVELLLDTPQFFVMFWNTFKLVVPSILGQLLVGAPAAWALSRLKFKGRKALLTIYIALMLMPFQVSMVPNFLVIDKLGLMDTLWAVVLPFAFSAYPVFIMVKGFDAVPKALLEAAAIDGASHFRIFISIGLPLGMPGILSALVLGFLECWSAIEQPMTFFKDPSLWPLSLYLPQIVAEKLGLAMAASLFMLAPAMLVFLFGQKYLELGIQSAGLKE